MVCLQKWQFFQLFVLGNIGRENLFYDILERKIAFLGYKKKKFKKSNIGHFSKGVNPWFWFKNGDFSRFFFFRQYRPGKCLLRCSRTKSSFLSYKNKKFYNWKNWHFLKWVNPCFWSKTGNFFNFFFRHYWAGKCLLLYSRTKKSFSSL